MSKEQLPKLLQDLSAEIDQGFIEDTFEVQGHKYKLRLLSDGESNWKNRYIDGLSSALSLMSQRKSATLAIAIRAIDANDVVTLFAPTVPTADSDDAAKKEYEEWTKATKLERQFNVAKKMYDFLSQRPNDFTTELFDGYSKLEDRRKEVIKNLKKS
jgi:hypothetical protein